MSGATTLSRAIAKRKKGEKLTAAETNAVREYQRGANQRAARIYFESDEELGNYKALCEEQGGRSFSTWIREKLDLGVQGDRFDPAFIEQLRAENVDLRKRLEAERDETEYYRAKARELEVKVAEYADVFFRLAADKAQEQA